MGWLGKAREDTLGTAQTRTNMVWLSSCRSIVNRRERESAGVLFRTVTEPKRLKDMFHQGFQQLGQQR